MLKSIAIKFLDKADFRFVKTGQTVPFFTYRMHITLIQRLKHPVLHLKSLNYEKNNIIYFYYVFLWKGLLYVERTPQLQTSAD